MHINAVNVELPIFISVTHWHFLPNKQIRIAVHTHTNWNLIILIYVHSTRLLETLQYSGALGITCSIQMPWLQIKARGEKAQWNPGRVTHIQKQWLHPQQLDGYLRLVRNTENFLTSASASCQLCGRAPLLVPRVVVAVSVSSSFPDALMGNVRTSRRGSCTRSDHMTADVTLLPWAALSGHIGWHGEPLFISTHLW